jgi:hypothetical protein
MIMPPIRRAWLFELNSELGIAFERSDGTKGRFAKIDPQHPEFKLAFKAMSLRDQRALCEAIESHAISLSTI